MRFQSLEQPARPRVLVVLHQENSSPGRVGQELVKRGFALDIRKPRFGDSLPRTLADHAGAVIFGGPMSANDSDAFVQREIDWIGVPLKEKKPFLGICLGAQMMVRYLGGKVCCHNDGLVEIGYYPLRPTDSGRALMKWPGRVYQWHREGFDLPAGCELLAEGETYRNQAIRYGPAAYGIQFHPELTHAMMVRWTTKGAPRMALPGAQQRHDHFAGRYIFDGAVRAWLHEFLDLWIGHADDHRQTCLAAAAE
ncbi:glutamine amidotransferase [Polymorphum gilvum]|uniref:Class I glutamine amidotransferase domain protein n=1 Tax=Polymorphum gilvum (strain LMG 25793 / CGMCC 1.9160 / SL003B-26A1) TaxID=991905 RepID=F2J2W9_POLGS|nr:glutamine amidotransferase [Polymorphum gilvum]ADZ68839.1 Class I glutamine amidotransferase domain protein [Polymorphum gilvum SL003B-26A1]